MEELELVKRQEEALAEFFGEELPAGSDAGLLDDDRDEMSPPRLLICQDLSAVVTAQEAASGEIYSQAQGRAVGQPLFFTPLYIHREWVEWDGFGAGATIVWRTSDPQDERITGDPESFKKKQHNWVVLATGETVDGTVVPLAPTPEILVFKRSSMPEGRRFYASVKRGRYPGYAQRYRLSSVADKVNPGNYLPVTRFDGYLTPQEVERNKRLFEDFSSKSLSPVLDGDDATNF